MIHARYLHRIRRGELPRRRVEDLRRRGRLGWPDEAATEKHPPVGEQGRAMEGARLLECASQRKRATHRIEDFRGTTDKLRVFGAAEEAACDEHAAVGQQRRGVAAPRDEQDGGDLPLSRGGIVDLALRNARYPSPGDEHAPVGEEGSGEGPRANALQISRSRELRASGIEALGERCARMEGVAAVDSASHEEKGACTQRDGDGVRVVERAQRERRPGREPLCGHVEAMRTARVEHRRGVGSIPAHHQRVAVRQCDGEVRRPSHRSIGDAADAQRPRRGRRRRATGGRGRPPGRRGRAPARRGEQQREASMGSSRSHCRPHSATHGEIKAYRRSILHPLSAAIAANRARSPAHQVLGLLRHVRVLARLLETVQRLPDLSGAFHAAVTSTRKERAEG